MKKISKIFLSGITTILPISVTIFIMVKLFVFIDGIIGNLLASLIGERIIGLGFLIEIALVLFVGLLSQKIIHVFSRIKDHIFRKVPIAGTIYNAVKEISDSFFNKQSTAFSTAVLVKYPNENFQSLGFITNESVIINDSEKISVFIPTTPNPTSGFLVIVDRANVEIVDLSVEEAMKMIISLGVMAPKMINKKIQVN